MQTSRLELLEDMLWTLLTFTLVILTKYATSIRLRKLRDKIHRDQQDASELRTKLEETVEREEMVEKEQQSLRKKVATLHTVIANLQNALGMGLPDDTSDRG